MNTFDDILKAEQEAEESIADIKEKIAQAIISASSEKKIRIESELAKLKEEEKKAIEAHVMYIADKTEETMKKVTDEVALIEKKFKSHKSNLVETIKKKFI